MNEVSFESFLINKKYTRKSIVSRLSRARTVSKYIDMDDAVSSLEKMKSALLVLRQYDNREENLQNALRSYYEFKNGDKYPKLKDL